MINIKSINLQIYNRIIFFQNLIFILIFLLKLFQIFCTFFIYQKFQLFLSFSLDLFIFSRLSFHSFIFKISTKYQRNNVECQLWTKDELTKLFDLAAKYNKNWDKISHYFANRSPNSLKTKYNYELRKQRKKQESVEGKVERNSTIKVAPPKPYEVKITTTHQQTQNPFQSIQNYSYNDKQVEKGNQVVLDQSILDCPFLIDEQLSSFSVNLLD